MGPALALAILWVARAAFALALGLVSAYGSTCIARYRQRVPRFAAERSTAAFQGRAPLHVFPYLFVHVRYYTDTGFALSLRNDPGPGAGSGPVA